ncbi:MAG TPA: PilZ domain-containing protein [Thermodesulfobacteriota bacterium]|nr:PilZ domain-containing protein [Thermodesulfobacteriota bacterium]
MEKSDQRKSQFGIVNFERRKSARFSVNLPVEFSEIDASEFKGAGHAADASVGGLMLYLPAKLEIGQHLKVKLFFTSEPGLDCIEAVAEIVWTDFAFSREGDNRYGVKFLNISAADLDRMKKFLENLASQKAPLRIAR